MATRSTIALESADGTIGQVYCHFDGYLENNGQILQEHYSDPAKLRKLIDLGDLSSLGPNIGTKHDFKTSDPNVCTFYGRDRGENGIEANYFNDYNDYLANLQFEDYNYILRHNKGNPIWFVQHYDSDDRFETLAFALERQSVESLK